MNAIRSALVMLALGIAIVTQAAESISVVNPSFEDTKAEMKGPAGEGWTQDGVPPGWHSWIGEVARRGKPILTWEKGDAHTGNRSVSLQACMGGVCVIQNVPVQPKESYLCSVWVKATNPKATCRLNIRWQTQEGKWANTASAPDDLPPNTKPNEWTKLSVPFQAPDNAGFAVILLTASDQKESDKCWFDDVRLQHIAPEDVMIAGCGWLHPNCAPMGKPMETPHVPWAKPYAGGRLKALFLLGNDHNLREHIEIAQRMDIEYDWAFAHSFDAALFAIENNKIMSRLEEGYYDVIVLGTQVTAPMAQGLARRCKGMVVMAYRNPGERTAPDGKKSISWGSMIPPVPKDAPLAEAGPDHFICEPLDAMPAIPLTGDPSVQKVEVSEGKTRIARLTFNTRFFCLTPVFKFDEHLGMGGEYWEAYHQAILRAILWAGSREFPVKVELRSEGGSVVMGDLGEKGQGLKREVRICDRLGRVFQGAPDFAIPKDAASGPATVGVILRDGEGKAVGFAATRVDVKKSPRIVEVRPVEPYYLGTDAAKVRVKIEGPADGMKLFASLTDAFGREHARAEAEPKGDGVVLDFPLGNRLSNFNWIDVKLRNGDEVCDAARWYLLAPLPRKPWLDEFQIGTWASSGSMPQYLQPPLHTMMKEAGLTEGLQGADGYLSMLASGLWPISTAYGKVPGFTRWDKKETARKPCLSNPDDRKQMADVARETAAGEIGVCPLLAYLCDETSLVMDDLDLDVCSCEHCVKRFRIWLQERYKSIEDLNKDWATAYKSWEEVGFTTYKDVQAGKTCAPWLMYRRFMDWTWAEGIEWTKKGAKSGDPGILVAMPNTFGPNPFSGRDYYFLSKVNEYRLEYASETRSKGNRGSFYDALRSFAPEVRDHPWIGYRFDDETILYAPWWTAFHGATGFSVYGTMSLFAGKNSWAQVFPTLQHTRRGRMYADQAKELKEGIGKLLIEARRARPPIAILWSQPSMYVAWVLSGQTGHPMVFSKNNAYGRYFTSRESFRLAATGGGRQFNYLVEKQIAEGALKDYSCLVLPAVYALSDSEIETIRRFVEDGGTVIADVGVGLTNAVGARRANHDRVGGLFGFRRKSESPVYVERPLRLRMSPDPITVFGREEIEALPGAECEPYEDGVPALLRTTRGKGRTIFLNFVTDRSAELRGVFDGVARIGEVVSADGARRPADYDLVEFEMGAGRYLGVTHFHLNDDPNDEKIVIRLGAAAEVYDVRGRKSLGKKDAIEAAIPPGGAAFYSLLPYRVEGVDVTCGPAKERSKVDVACVVRADGQVGDHVLRVDVLRPDGAAHPAYCRNIVARGGKGVFAIPLALNDPQGRWTVVCRDVATGVEGKAGFDLPQ